MFAVIRNTFLSFWLIKCNKFTCFYLKFVPEGETSGHSAQSKPSAIWFRFNEGYSNAVRKSVKVQELL